MTTTEIRDITLGRCALWQRHLIDGHATPVILIGVGHDHASGDSVLCTLDEDEMTDAILVQWLRHVALLIERGQIGRGR